MNSLRTLISVDALRARIAPQPRASDFATGPAATDTAIIDCRADLLQPTRGREWFNASHLPQAQFADLNTMLSAPAIAGQTGRHPLPEIARFIAAAAALGIGDDTAVVCYDQGPGAYAARLWWLLRWVGHANVAVLDGGFNAWTRSGGALETGPATSAHSGQLHRGPTLTRTLSAGQLARMGVVLDARDAPRYRGDVEPIDTKAGHIPGAINAPYTANLTPDGVFKPRAELLAQFAAHGAAQPAGDVAVYCGSGVTACHDILALVHAGCVEPALYPGSFSEWITDPTRAVATGPAP